VARAYRRWLRRLAIFVGAICVLLILALFVLQSGPVRRYALNRVTTLLAERHIELNTDELRYNLLNASLDLRNVRVRSSDLPDAPVFATIKRARIDVSLPDLLRGRYIVQSGRVEGVEVHYYVDEQGRDNLPRPLRDPNEPTKPLDYLISKASVTGARVRYENRGQQVDADVPIDTIEVEGDRLTDRHQVRFESANATVRIKERTTPIERITGDADLGNEQLILNRLSMDSQGSHAEATDVTYDLTTRQANVSSVYARGEWGEVKGGGAVALNSTERSNVKADIVGVDAGWLMQAFGLPYTVATRVDGNVKAEWPGVEYLQASVDAEATLTPTTDRVARSTMPIGGQVVVRGRDGRIDAEIQQVTAAGAQVAGRVVVSDDRRLNGQLKGQASDVARVVTSLEAFLGRSQGSLLDTNVNGPVTFDTRIAGTIDVPSATSTVNAPALKVGTAEGLALSADIDYAPAAVTVRRADLTWEELKGHVEGRVGLAGDRRLDLTLSADSVSVPFLLEVANQEGVPASGVLSLRGTVGGTTARPTAMITVQGSDLVAYEETFGALDAEVTLAGRDVTISRLELEKPQPDRPGRIAITGTYDLDRRSYTAEATSEGVRMLGLRLPGGEVIRGDVQLTAKGAGTTAAPSGTVDLAFEALEIERPSGDASRTIPVGALVVHAVAEKKSATITAKADQYNVDADALIALARPWPATIKVRANDLDLATLPIGAPADAHQGIAPPLQGQLRATVEASGDLAAPSKGKATASIESLMGSWNTRPFSVKGPAVLRYEDERLDIERLEAEASGSVLTVTGELPLTDQAGEGKLQVELKGNLATLTQYLPPDVQVAGDGAVDVTGSLTGTLKAINPDLVVTIDKGLVLSAALEPGFSNIQMRARIFNGEVNVEQLSGNWGSATIDASGRIPLEVVPPLPVEIPRMGGPTTLKATVRGLNPAAIPGASGALGGIITLQADLSAARADLAALDGTITFPELEITFRELDIAQQQPSVISIANGTASLDTVKLAGSAGEMAATGRVGLTGARTLDVNVDGNLNAGAASVITDRIRAEGDTTLKLQVRGTVAEPDLHGTVTLTDGSAISDEPNIAAENLNAEVTLDGKRIVLTRFMGDMNGGTVEGSGSLTLGEGGIAEVDLTFSTKDFAFDAPLELRSLSDSEIRITRDGQDILVSGRVTLTEGGLTGDINFDEGLMAAMTARHKLDLTEERTPFLSRLRFDVNVSTATPILVDNNLARAEVRARVRVVGTPYEPGATGQLTLLEGGEVRLNERRYEVERGIITLVDERRIFPSFDLLLHTSAGNYDINIAVTGVPGDTQTTLTSDPTLPEPDIMAMLVTGRTVDDMRGEEFEVAREQVLSYLAGRVGNTLGRGLQEATGLSEVRIEPEVIANETEPTARLTLGQDLTDELKLVYSTNLTDSNDQIWVAEYDVTRRFQTRAVRQSDATYRMDFSHDVRFGGQAAPRREARVRPKIASVDIVSAETGERDAEVGAKFKLEPGDSYDYFKVRNAIADVESSLVQQGYLQSRVRLERKVDNEQAHLTLRVRRGPRVTVQYQGDMPPAGVQSEVRTQWHRGVFDKQRAEAGKEALRGWLMTSGYLQPKVEYQIDEASGDRRVTYQVQRGPHYDKIILAFEGASGIPPGRLDKLIEQQELERQLFTDPLVVTELLARYYREQGFLAAELEEPRLEFQGSTARVVVPVKEGPKFTVRSVTASGNKVWGTDALIQQLPVLAEEPYLPAAAERAIEKLRTLYWPLGYNDMRSDYSLVVDRLAGQVDVNFTIAEGPQSIVGDITVRGNRRISERLVRRQIELATAQPLDLGALAKSRRNLYDTEAFSVVEIDSGERMQRRRRETAEGEQGPFGLDPGSQAPSSEPAAAPDSQATDARKPVPLNVFVREVQPVQLRYGASYDTEGGLGGIVDISQHNWLRGARVIGMQARYDSQLHDVRLYINQPALTYLPVKTTGSVYFREDLSPPTEITRPFNASRKGAAIQQEVKLRDSYLWSWGYRYERAQTIQPGQMTAGVPHTVSPLTSTLSRETRDDALDASKGTFASNAFAFSPGWLGSDLPYLKYMGQYFHYFPLQRPQRKPFTNELLRPRLVYATGVRVGLARGIGGDVPISERFFAGGSVTLRGFAQNAVGPIGPDLVPLGGNALFILNNELRAPLFSIVDGVVFVDIGNVWPLISDLSLTDLRQSTGAGLRLRTPWFLIRGDYGFVLDPRPGEKRGRFYFSIGQAF
jgi:outer membrane protein assembly factor BamA/autotransporter translocation and assembly factor TamB